MNIAFLINKRIEKKNHDTNAVFFSSNLNLPLNVCLVGVKSGWMKNKCEKSGEKMVGVAVWLGGEGGEKTSGARCFLPKPTKNQSPQIEEIIREKTRSKLLSAFGHIFPSRHVSNFWTF